MREVNWIGVVVLAGSAVLGACTGPGGAGARGADAPNTGLSVLTEAPVGAGLGSESELGARGGADGGEVGEPARTGVGAGRSRTRLDTLAADTDVNVDDLLASAEGRGGVRAPVASESVDGGGLGASEGVAEGATDGVTGGGVGETTQGALTPLEGDAPNAGLAALAGEEVGATAKPDEQAAGAREAEVAKLAALRRDLGAFLGARREQGAKLMADAALIVIGDAIGYDGEARPSTPDETALTSQERTTLSAIRALGRALSQEGKVGDPARAAQLVEGVLSTLREAAAVRIARAALCTRVEGFGRYEPFSEYTFLAGRVTKMIVYTEVENFSHRMARSDDPGMDTLSGAELVAVELSQELGLWHDADGSMQWRKPEQPIIEVGRNKRRDFFLVQQVELPSTLSVGKYNLKVTVRDRVSGGVDERSIAIKIVADAGVIGRK